MSKLFLRSGPLSGWLTLDLWWNLYPRAFSTRWEESKTGTRVEGLFWDFLIGAAEWRMTSVAQVAEGGENLSVGQRQLVCLTRWIEIGQKISC